MHFVVEILVRQAVRLLHVMKTIQILAFVGILVSFYALYVESKTGTKDAMGKPYEAMCDTKIFGYVVSCSKVFESKYGKML